MASTRTRIITMSLVSVGVLAALFATLAVSLSGLSGTRALNPQSSLSPTPIADEAADTTSLRGYFCTENGDLPTHTSTDNGRYRLVDITTSGAYTLPAESWLIFTAGCYPLDTQPTFLDDITYTRDNLTWNPSWFVPHTDTTRDRTWFTRITDSGDVRLRPSPLDPFDAATHPSVPTLALRLPDSDVQSFEVIALVGPESSITTHTITVQGADL